MDKTEAVKLVLEKRFGVIDPEKIPDLAEINTIECPDKSEDSYGVGVELILEDETKEEYQVSSNGIIFSWGNTSVIDERSLSNKL